PMRTPATMAPAVTATQVHGELYQRDGAPALSPPDGTAAIMRTTTSLVFWEWTSTVLTAGAKPEAAGRSARGPSAPPRVGELSGVSPTRLPSSRTAAPRTSERTDSEPCSSSGATRR